MSHSFRCPHCSTQLTVENPQKQTALLCPNCRRGVAVPGVHHGPIDIPVPSWNTPAPLAPSQPGLPWAVAAGILIALSVGIGVFWYTRKPQENTAEGASVVTTPAPGAAQRTTSQDTSTTFALGENERSQPSLASSMPQTPTPTTSSATPPPTSATPTKAPAPVQTKASVPLPLPLPLPSPGKSEGPSLVTTPGPGSARPKRLQLRDDEDLRRELAQMPEAHIDHVANTAGMLVRQVALRQQSGQGNPGPAVLLAGRMDLAGLPFLRGESALLGQELASDLQTLSRELRRHIESAIPRGSADPRPDADKLRAILLASRDKWLRPGAVPVLLQMLQAENPAIRLLLVELLGEIPDRRATAALTMRAITDLSPQVRDAALERLQTRPAEHYRDLVLSGLRHPWLPISAHAAEALVTLRHRDVVPQLVRTLEEPPPALPYVTKVNGKDRRVITEMVRLNHMSNCLLCHAPSFQRADLVRGAVPIPGRTPPGPATTPAYYEREDGPFVRADITFLRQDFSVVQPVPNPGTWPTYQRYDYLVRVRPLLPEEQKELEGRDLQAEASRLRAPVLWALRELTGKDFGTDIARWREAYPETAPVLATESIHPDWRQFMSAGRNGG